MWAVVNPWTAIRQATWLQALCVAALFGAGPSPAIAALDAQHICDRAAQVAAAEVGVPLDVLRAISRAETGRTRNGEFQPWPWTVNMEGAGRWFPTADAALSHVFTHVKDGARSFDVGCFQINHKWHGSQFASIEEMFQPRANALYAARFLKALHAELGDWSAAVGAYHSRTPELASRYVARFERIRVSLDTPATPMPTPRAPTRLGVDIAQRSRIIVGNGTQISKGSLVPIDPTRTGRTSLLVWLN